MTVTVKRTSGVTRRRLCWNWCIFQFLLAAFAFTAIDRSRAAEPPTLEYRVKAAFLLNFTKFVEWPNDGFPLADSPIAVCVAGDAPLEQVLARMVEGESVGGRKVITLRAPPDASKCQILFVSKSEKEVPRLLAEVGRGVLTVGEAEGFLADGGMIDFVIENRRVRFDINQKAVANSALKLSSKLFNVARQVEK